MKTRLSIRSASWFAILALAPSAGAQAAARDWPHFGGPKGTGIAEAPDTRFAWGEKGPTVLWKTATGPGYGGAAVQGGEVFLFDCELGEMDVLRVFDLETGAEKWSAAYEAKGRLQFPGSRTVPAVTEDAVFTCGGFGHVTCFDRKSHEIRWTEHLGETYGGEDPGFGWSSAPILIGDKVVFTSVAKDVGLVALDCKSGEERWVSQGLGSTHSTPALLELLGKQQLVLLSTEASASGLDQAAPMTISSVDPGSGELLWQQTITLSRLPIAPPLQIDAQRFFVTGGYRGGSSMLRLLEKDGKYSLEELFHVERGAQVHAPLRHGDELYILVNENWNSPRNNQAEGGLMCLSLEGKELWRTKDNPYFGLGNALLAGDHLLIQDGDDGTLRVVRANAKSYELVAEAKLFPETRAGQMWAPMALAGKRLLLRSQEELLCVEL